MLEKSAYLLRQNAELDRQPVSEQAAHPSSKLLAMEQCVLFGT